MQIAAGCRRSTARTSTVTLDAQQQREAVLGDQLLSLKLPHVVCHPRPLRDLAARQDGHVGGVDRLAKAR